MTNATMNWKNTRKKQYEVYICMPKIGSKGSNKLTGETFVTDQKNRFIVSGVVGEKTVIGIEQLVHEYVNMDGTPITKNQLEKAVKLGKMDWMHLKTAPIQMNVTAMHIKDKTQVQTMNGTMLANKAGIEHGPGDFIVADNNGNQILVNGAAFPFMFDLRAFPGLYPASIKEYKTPEPTESVFTKAEKDQIARGETKIADNGTKAETVKGAKYQVVGRYMSGNKVVGYHIQSLDSNSGGRVDCNTFAFLVGREDITNCSGQLYKNSVIYRGNGIEMSKLPAKQINGGVSNADNIRKSDTTDDIMNKMNVCARVRNGNAITHYQVANAGGGKKIVTRDEFLNLVREGKIGNVKIQNYQGKAVIKGVGCSLRDLPIIEYNTPDQQIAATEAAVTEASAPVETPVEAPAQNTTPVSSGIEIRGLNGKPVPRDGVMKAAKYVANAFKSVENQTGWKVAIEVLDDREYRVAIEKDGAHGYGIIDFRGSNLEGKACYLKDFCEDVRHVRVFTNNNDSIKQAMNMMDKAFKLYK